MDFNLWLLLFSFILFSFLSFFFSFSRTHLPSRSGRESRGLFQDMSELDKRVFVYCGFSRTSVRNASFSIGEIRSAVIECCSKLHCIIIASGCLPIPLNHYQHIDYCETDIYGNTMEITLPLRFNIIWLCFKMQLIANCTFF